VLVIYLPYLNHLSLGQRPVTDYTPLHFRGCRVFIPPSTEHSIHLQCKNTPAHSLMSSFMARYWHGVAGSNPLKPLQP
jgi:hypothetical protein